MKLCDKMKLWEVTYDGGGKRVRTRYQDLYKDFEDAIKGDGFVVSIKEFNVVLKRKIPINEMERVLFALGKGLK